MTSVGFYSTEGWERERLERELGAAASFTFYEQPLGGVNDGARHEIVVVRPDSILDVELLNGLPDLRYIVTRSTGFDHIDLATAATRGIRVLYVPSYGSATVAEHAFALLLCLSKRVFDGYEQVRERSDFDPRRLRGFDLAGRTIGMIGTGSIGRHAVGIAQGFRMSVVAHDVRPDEAFAAERGIRYLPLEELLSVSDVVMLHVPANPQTRHLLNRGNLPLMKQGSVLINTSRGSVVETEAIVKALAEGRLRGAGLDVFEEEAVVRDELHLLARGDIKEEEYRLLVANHVLVDHPGVIVTPHSAYNTDEALARIMDTTVQNVQSILSGAPINVVG